MPILGPGKLVLNKSIFGIAYIKSMSLGADYKTNFPSLNISMNEAYIYQVSPSNYLSHT
jgi:hypothetical protein